MLRMYRAMICDGQGPAIGSGEDMLGAYAATDIEPDGAGDSLIGSSIQLIVGKRGHGQIEPAFAMPIEAFQQALAATQKDWKPIPEDVECPAASTMENQ